MTDLNLLYNRDFVTYTESKGRSPIEESVWAFKEAWPVLQFKLKFYAWQD